MTRGAPMEFAPSAAAVDAVIAAEPYFGFLGLRRSPGEDSVTLVLPAADHHIGDADRRSIHGGILGAFLEAAAVVALRAVAAPAAVRTVAFTTEFLREAAIVDTSACVVPVRRGRRFASVRVEAWQHERSRLVAIGYGTFTTVV